MSNVTPETLTRAEAHRKLLALGMPANVAADYLGDDPPFVARSMVSLTYPGAWPILEAYRRYCKSKAATDPIDTVPAEERERVCDGAIRSDMSALLANLEFSGDGLSTMARICRTALRLLDARRVDADNTDALFVKWTPLLSPYLNEEQLADLRRDIAVDNHPRHRDGNCNDCGAPATKGSASMGQFCARCAPAELPDLETRSAPVPVAVAADRLASGHVQRLRDGTWEWCHDGGFDNGVVALSPKVSAWLSDVVNDAMYRRRTRGQSGITWSTAIKVAIALAPHGDVTAQAQTVMRIAGKHQGITEEAIDALHALAGAICATQGRDPEQKAQLQRIAEAHDALRYALGDKYPGEHVGPTIEDIAYADIRAERASQIAKGRIPEKDDARSGEDWHACLMGVLGALCNDTRRRWVKVGSVAVAAIQSLDRRAGHGEHGAKRGGQ